MYSRYRDADHPLAYGLARGSLGIYESLAHHLEVKGRENIPKFGGAILAISHRDGYDPIASGTAARRPVFFMAKHELWTPEYDFTVPVINKTMNAGKVAEYFGAFPVKRGEMERATLDHSLALVGNREAGKLLGVFPEQTRFEDEETRKVWGKELGPLSPGVASIAIRLDVPIIAMGLSIHREMNKKGKLRIVKEAAVIKEALEPDKDPEAPRKIRTLRTMAALREVLQEAHDEAHELAA